ncbi:beta-galactosidase [Exaiptasia diaphana]|uniref:Beta-galactosidase n=1 Tax=Exaiptasia diaphana TaxID=2652724 RepID=A0A913XJE0_EXADI|nr:beta-galactosidase [Exaiptasia diaphana]KXJ11601.1 Beta-galactosidase [Exaiptasia diaphana]
MSKFSPLLLLCFYVLAALPSLIESRSFTIDYENNVFLKDGQPFRYISGSVHYFRVPRSDWKDRLTKLKYLGLNAVQTYVAWNLHEPEQGHYNFEGGNDLVEFINVANSLQLLVVLRPGPYICGEWDLGGLPGWLLRNKSIILRSSKDQGYIQAVDRWMGVLLPKIEPLLYKNGGPIISVQVENEYGSYYTCDHDYMSHLEALFRQHLGNDTILFTTDGYSEQMLKCGTLPSLFTTVDFGSGVDPSTPFSILRKYQPKGPLVNSEFYPGWLDHWGEKHQTVNTAQVAKYLDQILALNASVNLYMFEGGTTFGFMNGANCGSNASQFQPQPTSYDYDAPLSEAGDPTQKYFVLLEIISRYMGTPSGILPPPSQKYSYGQVNMTKMSYLIDVASILSPMEPVKAVYPLTMEQFGQYHGFALYQTEIPKQYLHSSVTIDIPGVRDRAIVYVGKIRQATISRTGKTSATLIIGEFLSLSILIENMGHINYGRFLVDPKGILGNVTINNVALTNWQMRPLNLTNILRYQPYHLEVLPSSGLISSNAPTFFTGQIPPASDGIPKDTFLKLKNWNKGQVFINGFNLGRYWTSAGPQETLYVPASLLYASQPSKIVMLELDDNPCDYPDTCFVTFQDTPIIDGPVKPLLHGRRVVPKPVEQWISKYTQELHAEDSKVDASLRKYIEGVHRKVV